MTARITIQTSRQGLLEITDRVAAIVNEAGVRDGLCTIMMRRSS